MRAYFQVFFVLVLSLLFGCTRADELPAECYTPAGCSPQSDTADTSTTPDDTGNGDDTGSDSGDTADSGDSDDTGDSSETEDTDITDEINCWYDLPYQIKTLNVDRSIATTVSGDWDGGLDWVDYDPGFQVDASTNNIVVDVYTYCGSTSYEGEIEIPDDFVMRDPSENVYNNGIFSALQSNGTILEVNYFEDCGDGTFGGYLLPDDEPYSACAAGYSTTERIGAHGGSGATATQQLQPSEFTDAGDIERGIQVEVDATHMTCPDDAIYGYDCFIGPLVGFGDSYALTGYTGSIAGLTMGGVLILPEGYDCENSMRTVPGLKLCKVARDYFYYIVDDSAGVDEVAFPMEDSVRDEVIDAYGIDVHDATGDYHSDIEDIFADILVVTNPEAAIK